jgi:hypothetical protein
MFYKILGAVLATFVWASAFGAAPAPILPTNLPACPVSNCTYTVPVIFSGATASSLTTWTNGTQSATLAFQNYPEFGETDITLTSNATNGLYIQDTAPDGYTSTCYAGQTFIIAGCMFHFNGYEGTATVTISGSVMTVTGSSPGLRLNPYQSISGGSPTLVTSGTYITSQASGTPQYSGIYNLSQPSTISSSETVNVTYGGMDIATECSPLAFGTTDGCYLPPQMGFRQEWNDPGGSGNKVYYWMNVDNFHNVSIDGVSGGGWMPFGVNYASGSVGVGCPGNTFPYAAQFEACQLADFIKGITLTTTGAPTPVAGQGAVGASYANGLEFSGWGSTYDVAFKSRAGSVAAGILPGSTNFQVVGDFISGGGSAQPTATTTGFLHMPYVAAAPTGTPAIIDGNACIVNTGTQSLNCYIGSSWYHIAMTSGAN